MSAIDTSPLIVRKAFELLCENYMYSASWTVPRLCVGRFLCHLSSS